MLCVYFSWTSCFNVSTRLCCEINYDTAWLHCFDHFLRMCNSAFHLCKNSTSVIRTGAFFPGINAVVMIMSTSLHWSANNVISASMNSLLISFAYPPPPSPSSFTFTVRNWAPSDSTCSLTDALVSNPLTTAPWIYKYQVKQNWVSNRSLPSREQFRLHSVPRHHLQWPKLLQVELFQLQ